MMKFLLFLIFPLFCMEERIMVVAAEDSLLENNATLPNQYAGPVMVPVSSTVIPIANLFGPPRPLKSGFGSVTIPKKSSTYYLSPARRARILERSGSRPDEPVRLITKNSKQKEVINETH